MLSGGLELELGLGEDGDSTETVRSRVGKEYPLEKPATGLGIRCSERPVSGWRGWGWGWGCSSSGGEGEREDKRRCEGGEVQNRGNMHE